MVFDVTRVEYWHTADGLFHEVDNRRIPTQRIPPSYNRKYGSVYIRTVREDNIRCLR